MNDHFTYLDLNERLKRLWGRKTIFGPTSPEAREIRAAAIKAVCVPDLSCKEHDRICGVCGNLFRGIVSEDTCLKCQDDMDEKALRILIDQE